MESGDQNQFFVDSEWIIVNKRDGKSKQLARSMVFVGREECDIILHSSSIDKRHAVIYFNAKDNLFYIKDLNSTYGTFINDAKIPELTYIKINHMDRIRFVNIDLLIFLFFVISLTRIIPPDTFLICRIPSPSEAQKSLSTSVLSKNDFAPINSSNRTQQSANTFSSTLQTSEEFSIPQRLLNMEDIDFMSTEESKNSNSSVSTIDSLDENKSRVKNKTNGTQLSPVNEGSVHSSREYKFCSDNKTKNKNFEPKEEEKAEASTPSASAMAFTIAFDEGKKKMLCSEPLSPQSDIEYEKPMKENLKENEKISQQQQDCKSPLGSARKNSPPEKGEKDSGVCEDDKSEAGTYTVDAENADPGVEDARKRIDEVFGVAHSSTEKLKSPKMSPNTSSFYLSHEFKEDIQIKSEDDVLSKAIKHEKQKRRLPSVPQIDNDEVSNPLLLKIQKNPNLRSQLLEEISPLWCSKQNDKYTDLKPQKNVTSYSEVKRSNTRKSTSSEVELSQSENASINSDESFEIKSCDSGKCKSDSNTSSHPMRFNRAFALRRARLGIDTPGIPIKKSPSSCTNQKKPNENRFTPSPNFNRTDGGRFSLRVSKNPGENRKPPIGSTANRSSSRENVAKPTHQRKLSDPRIQCQKKGNKHSFSDIENDSSRQSSPLHSPKSVHRSSSFAERENNESNARSSTSNIRALEPFQLTKRIFSTKPHQIARLESSMRVKNFPHDPMSSSFVEKKCSPTDNESSFQKKNSKELSALDHLVISAILQLSAKLRNNLGCILEKSRLNYPKDSEMRLMIEEMIPQFSVSETRFCETSDNTTSKDLSNILKNLKKVEQSLEVISLLVEHGSSISSARNQQQQEKCSATHSRR
ncbi:uncharacterized protein B4U79_02518 [Dinothrombium tinctorium]|uniref:FHA domain-containing protein n=1 Tax=Dinothrombium tinctorium TaxID=1965070 RepID=A0A3S3PRF2_9ACAR|nr:uncharacterized protein B4U79_02518 [Dinothrombium tinctorium]